MTRSYLRQPPNQRIVIRVIDAAVPAIGVGQLANLCGGTPAAVDAILGDVQPLSLMAELPEIQARWTAETGDASFGGFARALFLGISAAFVSASEALPQEVRPWGPIVTVKEVERLVRIHQSNPQRAHNLMTQAVAQMEAFFDALNRQIGTYQRANGRRAA
jgi:hypothetical protein